METELEHELRAKLLESRREWEDRLLTIQADRRRKTSPLESDSDDQAIQLENDEPLDALDARGRQELAEIEAALGRLDAGSFGRCVECGEEIAPGRLRARPTATTCVECAG